MTPNLIFGLGFGTGVASPVGVLAVAHLIGTVRHGAWVELDDETCDACTTPRLRWSPVLRCPGCGSRSVRGYLYSLLGSSVLRRLVARGPRDEAWLAGETDEVSARV